MLVRFVVDNDAIAESERMKLHEAKAVFLRLLQNWARFGVLLYEGSTFTDSMFYRNLGRLPQAVADRFKQGIKSRILRITPAPPAWPGNELISDADELTGLQGIADLVTLSEFTADLLGIAPDDISQKLCDDSLEVVRLTQIDQSERFRKADHMARSRIETGVSVLDAWNERFAPFCRHSQQITIVDRYAGDSHAQGLNGLNRCLSEIDRCASKATVSILTGDAEEKNFSKAEIMESLVTLAKEKKSRGGVRAVRLSVGSDELFKGGRRSVFPEGAHDRYIRFDNSVVSLGLGVSVFSGRTVEKFSTFQLAEFTDDERTIETTLHRRSTYREV